jgi:hypothetical protein
MAVRRTLPEPHEQALATGMSLTQLAEAAFYQRASGPIRKVAAIDYANLSLFINNKALTSYL